MTSTAAPKPSLLAPPRGHTDARLRKRYRWLMIVQLIDWEFRETGNLDAALRAAVDKHKVCYETARTLWTRYQQGGEAALEPKPLGPAKGTNARTREGTADPRGALLSSFPEAVKFICARTLQGENTVKITEGLRARWHSLGYPPPAPSRSTVARVIERNLSEAQRAFNREPRQQWCSARLPYAKRDWGTRLLPMELVEADHRKLDAWTANDCLPGAPRGSAIRVYVTAFEDWRTRKILGCVVSVSPDSITISRAFKQVVAEYGIPQFFYCDHGKDFIKFCSGAERGNPDDPGDPEKRRFIKGAPGTLARLGVKVALCAPRHPQAKSIESLFNYLRQFDAMWPGHCGSKPSARPDACEIALRQHQQFLPEKRNSTPLANTSDLIRFLDAWIERYNSEHHHSGDGMDGKTPAQVMEELYPASERRLPDMALIEHFFWEMHERKITRGGVEVDGVRYAPALGDDAGAVALLHAREEGKEFAVWRNPDDLSAAVIYEPGGALVAHVFADTGARRTREQQKEIVSQQKRLRRNVRESIAAICDGVPTPLEEFETREGLRRVPFDRAAIEPRKLPASSSRTWAADRGGDLAAIPEIASVLENETAGEAAD